MRVRKLICSVLSTVMLLSGTCFGMVLADSPTDTLIRDTVTEPDVGQIEAFVTRLYSLALDRQPDEGGLSSWSGVLTGKKGTGISVAYGFIYSGEFQGRDISNEQYVDLMYQMFFGREADAAGKAGWVNVLDSMDREAGRLDVFNGFANSTEFNELCSRYGIVAGTFVPGKDVDQVARVNLFVERLYNVVLGRECDKDGMAGWTGALLSGENTGAQAAYGFFFSPEYENSGKTYTQFVNDLYNAFMGREADEAGLTAWVNVLYNGGSKEHVFNGFSQSPEFGAICDSYGIIRGGEISEENNSTSSLHAEPTISATPTTSPTPAWPRIELSGRREDRVTPDVNSYYEGDNFILYVHEGATVRGCVAEDIERILGELQELYGMSYDVDHRVYDSDWRELYFDGDFEGLNPDCRKVNILLTQDPHNGYIEWGAEYGVLLYENDLLFEDGDPDLYENVAAHELAHVLQGRQSRIGKVLEEGMGVYAQMMISMRDGFPDYAGAMQYLRYDPWAWSVYDDSGLIADAEQEFIRAMAPDSEHDHYYFGVRFVKFRIDTYGSDVLMDICNATAQAELNTGSGVNTDQLVAIIKDCTSNDVFVRFSSWYVENWQDFSKEYIDFLVEQGIDLSNFDLTHP